MSDAHHFPDVDSLPPETAWRPTPLGRDADSDLSSAAWEASTAEVRPQELIDAE